MPPAATRSRGKTRATARSGPTPSAVETQSVTMISPACVDAFTAVAKDVGILANRTIMGVLFALAGVRNGSSVSWLHARLIPMEKYGSEPEIRKACKRLENLGLISGQPRSYALTSQGRQLFNGVAGWRPFPE